ncbi:hypothetical protein BT96DRAFT_1008798, partial [Gymnopus androsaceus JB14]
MTIRQQLFFILLFANFEAVMLEGPILGLRVLNVLLLPLGLRNNKEFRAYDLTPGRPIQGTTSYDLNLALESLQNSDDGSNFSHDHDVEHDIDLESDVSDLSDLADFGDELPAGTAPSSQASPLFTLSSLVGCILRPFQKPAIAPESDTEAEDIPLNDSSPVPETGLEARRKRKKQKNREKRRQRRKLTQEALGTRLKEIARRRAAQSQVLDAGDSFATESLP